MPAYSQKKVDLARKAAVTKWQWKSFEHPSRSVRRLLRVCPASSTAAAHAHALTHASVLAPALLQDGLELHHWRKAADDSPYKYANFDKEVAVPSFTSDEYADLLLDDDWTERETRLLMDL